MQTKTEPYANAAIILGVLSLLGGAITGIPAVICGHLARKKLKLDPRRNGAGRATVGIVLGYMMIALTVFVLSITFAPKI
jgi:hypothetical protein